MKQTTIKNKTAFKVGNHIWQVWSACKEEYVITSIKAYATVIDITCKDIDGGSYRHVFAENHLENNRLLSFPTIGEWCTSKEEAENQFRYANIREQNAAIAQAVRTLARVFKHA